MLPAFIRFAEERRRRGRPSGTGGHQMSKSDMAEIMDYLQKSTIPGDPAAAESYRQRFLARLFAKNFFENVFNNTLKQIVNYTNTTLSWADYEALAKSVLYQPFMQSLYDTIFKHENVRRLVHLPEQSQMPLGNVSRISDEARFSRALYYLLRSKLLSLANQNKEALHIDRSMWPSNWGKGEMVELDAPISTEGEGTKLEQVAEEGTDPWLNEGIATHIPGHSEIAEFFPEIIKNIAKLMPPNADEAATVKAIGEGLDKFISDRIALAQKHPGMDISDAQYVYDNREALIRDVGIGMERFKNENK